MLAEVLCGSEHIVCEGSQAGNIDLVSQLPNRQPATSARIPVGYVNQDNDPIATLKPKSPELMSAYICHASLKAAFACSAIGQKVHVRMHALGMWMGQLLQAWHACGVGPA